MEHSYNNMLKFMETYFADYNLYGGNPETLPRMLKYYLPDIQLFSYTLNAGNPRDLPKILQSMLHPGLHEEFTPRYYVVDTASKVVVVQVQNQFTEEAINKSYPPKQLSIHYYLADDPHTVFKIKKILFFVEIRPPEEVNLIGVIRKYQPQNMSEIVNKMLEGR
jgi:hypothetical protein